MNTKALWILFTFQFSGSVFAQSKLEAVECQSEKLDLVRPSQAETNAQKNNLRSSPNLVVDEFLWHERKKDSLLSSGANISKRNGKPHEITWEEARKMILRGYVSLVMQNHNRSVYLVTTRGSYFVTKEPKIDNVGVVVRAVDPCGLYIQYLTE